MECCIGFLSTGFGGEKKWGLFGGLCSRRLSGGIGKRGVNAWVCSVTRNLNYELGEGEMAVRFVNTPKGNDIVVITKPGVNLMALGDSVGLRIPRSCQTGLCGACTCDMEDPSWPDGKQLIRACSTNCAVPEDAIEMVVDVYRMGRSKERLTGSAATAVDPFRRFEDIDTQYVAGAAPTPRGVNREVTCRTCNGKSTVVCDECEGSGVNPDDNTYECNLCSGRGLCRCADCQGLGRRKFR